MLFSNVKISSFRAKAHLVFHWCLQLFRERLSEKVHATIPKGIVGGFEFTVLQRKLKELARKAMKMCLRVLKESNKSRFDSYSRQEQCIDHIPYYLSGLSRAHFFRQPFSKWLYMISDYLYCFTIRSLTTAHSRKRPALVTTTFSNFRGGRLRELRLYFLSLGISYKVIVFRISGVLF